VEACQPRGYAEDLGVGQTNETRIGDRLRAIRHERGLSISQLAGATGLTSGFISQLERDLTSVSLSSLARICAALDVRFGEVLDAPAKGELIRGEEASGWDQRIGRHDDLLRSPVEEPRFHLMESRIPPGEGAGEEPYTFQGDIELVYVLEGTLELRVREEVFLLEAGDTVTYTPRDPHTWRNPSSEDETVVLWFTVPNPFVRSR
jgi:transcriptional regulator with XRE-family HTH domain